MNFFYSSFEFFGHLCENTDFGLFWEIGNSRNYFATQQQPIVQFVKLENYPDGGIGRLELFGETVEGSVADHLSETFDDVWEAKLNNYLDLLPKTNGFPANFTPPPVDTTLLGYPNCDSPCSDSPPTILFPSLHDFGGAKASVIVAGNTQFSVPSNVLRPGRGLNMGDGWETARMRVPIQTDVFSLQSAVHQSYNWCLIQLNAPGSLHYVVVDTFHFVNNSPLAISIEGTNQTGNSITLSNYYSPNINWQFLIPPTPLKPHTEQVFTVSEQTSTFTHVFVKIYPCGGVSRIRFYGPLNSSSE